MDTILPPPPPTPHLLSTPTQAVGGGAYSISAIAQQRAATTGYNTSTPRIVNGWEVVEATDASTIPCQRSLHAGAVWKDYFIIFGGYDGLNRVNDLHAFHFPTNTWSPLLAENAPTPRDRHIAVVYENSLYIFGGFDGHTRVNGNVHEKYNHKNYQYIQLFIYFYRSTCL